MNVFLRPGAPLPGTVLEAEARFNVQSHTPVHDVSFELTGGERISAPRGTSEPDLTHQHVHQKVEQPGAIFTPGTHSVHASFTLPHDIPPCYTGTRAAVYYTLEVRARFPSWPDVVGCYSVPVAPPPVDAPITPEVFVSHPGGAVAGELYAEMSLASSVVEPGGELAGTIAFANASKARGVRVALIAWERVFAHALSWSGGSFREQREVQRWWCLPARDAPPDGAPLPFRFALPKELAPSFNGAMCALAWSVEVAAKGLLTWSSVFHAPITVIPKTRARSRSPAAVPVVGRERRTQSFQRAAEQAGLTYDDAHGEIRGAAGSVAVRIGIETWPDGKLVTVATLAWPSLGMGLRLGRASWIEMFFSRDIKIGSQFDSQFHVESRVPSQARALLDEKLFLHLIAFEEVRIDDEGASLAVPIALADERHLANFVESALKVARAFDAAFNRVPPPPELAAHEDAWRAFAARLSGRFEPGRPAILNGTVGRERVELATLWADDGKLDATELRIPLDTRIDPAVISPGAQALVASLEAPDRSMSVTNDAITLRLLRLVPDPAELDPLLETVLQLAQMVRVRGSAGPFRS
jgi:hypothetical protein